MTSMPDLATFTPQIRNLANLNVEVITSTNPDGGLLRIIREKIRQVPALSEVFSQANENRQQEHPIVDRDRLIAVLNEHYHEDGLEEVANYLADEYEQIGDGLLLISSETGRAIAKLTDDSYYAASPVPRESGTMAERGIQLRPEIEAFLTQWTFENAREKEVRYQVLAKLNQNELQREEGDYRTLVLSREGRRAITGRVQDAVGDSFRNPNGPARAFLDYFPIDKPLTEGHCDLIKVIPWSRIRRPIQDLTTVNSKHDAFTSTLASVVTSWVRLISGVILEEAVSRVNGAPAVSLSQALEGHDFGLWLAEPNLSIAITQQGCRSLPVPGPENIAVLLKCQAGHTELPDDKIGTNYMELHDRWTIESAGEALIHICWDLVDVVPIEGDFTSGISTEVI